MKRHLLTIATITVLVFAGTCFAADAPKYAAVDFSKIAQESKAGKEARKSLEDMKEQLKKSLKVKEKELDKLKAKLEANANKMTAQERTTREKEFRNKIEKFQESAQKAQKDFQAKEEETSGKIIDRIDAIIKEYAPKNSYVLVIRNGDFLYKDSTVAIVDVTDDIIKIFDGQPQGGAEIK